MSRGSGTFTEKSRRIRKKRTSKVRGKPAKEKSRPERRRAD